MAGIQAEDHLPDDALAVLILRAQHFLTPGMIHP